MEVGSAIGAPNVRNDPGSDAKNPITAFPTELLRPATRSDPDETGRHRSEAPLLQGAPENFPRTRPALLRAYRHCVHERHIHLFRPWWFLDVPSPPDLGWQSSPRPGVRSDLATKPCGPVNL